MENEQRIMQVLSELRYECQEDARKAARCYALTIVLLCALIVGLLPVLVSAWNMVLVRLF
jgi:hypothetical protein